MVAPRFILEQPMRRPGGFRDKVSIGFIQHQPGAVIATQLRELRDEVR